MHVSHSDAIPVATINDVTVEIRVSENQHIHGWLGSSIRGWLLAAMKGIQRIGGKNDDNLPLDPLAMCRLAKQIPKASEASCSTCWIQQNCAFGKTFEGGLRPPTTKGATQRNPPKAACFLSPILTGIDTSADRIQVSIAIQLVGHYATAEVSAVVERLQGIRDGNIGPHVARLWADAAYVRWDLISVKDLLVSSHGKTSEVASVDLLLESPLFVKNRHFQAFEGDRPFGFLFDQSLGIIETLISQEHHREIDFRNLSAMAKTVVCSSRNLDRLGQSRSSSRTIADHPSRRKNYEVAGWYGSLTFPEVPVNLLPWIRWGGILGIGDHRTAGGGRWSTIVRRSS